MKRAKQDNRRKSKEYQEFFDEFCNNVQDGPQWDRMTAILGVAFLDEHLKHLLENYLVDNKAITDFLDDADFSSKTVLAHGIGFLGQKMFADLKTLGSIRNRFAHDLQNRSFADIDISAMCKNLTTCDLIGMASNSPRQRFTDTVILLATQIGTREFEAQASKRVVGKDIKSGGVVKV